MAGMSSDVELLKDIPGYKAILKSVLKSQIQMLVEQLSEHTGEESMILTASIHDGTLSHQGSNTGRGFLDGRDEIKSQFLGFCLKSHHKKKSSDTRPSPYQRPQTSVQAGRTTPTQGPVKKVPRLQVQPVSLQRVLSGDNTAGSRPPDMQRAPSQVYSESGQEGNSVSVKLESSESGVPNDDTDNFAATSVTFPSSIHQSHTLTAGDISCENNESQNSTEDYAEHVSENDDSSAANTCIKIEPITENEMELEITGVEPSKVSSQCDSWSHGGTSFGATPTVGTVDGSSFSEASDNSYNKGTSVKHTPHTRRRFKCDVCGKCFSSRALACFHTKNVHEHSTQQSVCLVCKKRFSTVFNMKQHQQVVHMNIRPHECQECNKCFQSRRDLLDHTRHSHSTGDKYKCDQCEKEFDYKKSLIRHAALCGKQHKDVKCELCPELFRSKGVLANHVRAKHGNQESVCAYCGKRFEWKSSHDRHLKTVHRVDN